MWAHRQYENFTVVSWLLPRQYRQDFYNVYTYCRWSDNLADEVTDSARALQLLDLWSNELESCVGGQATHPVLKALQCTFRRHPALSVQPFQDLLRAFRQDQQVKRYTTLEQLQDYCQYSADPVGRILLVMAQTNSSDNYDLSDQVCSGLQLANFCQDMSRDAAMNRIYLPASIYEAQGVTEQELLQRQFTTSMGAALNELVQVARRHLLGGWQLVHRVPKWLATDVDLFVRGGLAILDKIQSQGCDVWSERPTVSHFDKTRLLMRSMCGRVFPRLWGSGSPRFAEDSFAGGSGAPEQCETP